MSPTVADGTLQAVAEIAMQGLTTRYQLAWREIFRFIGALFLGLRDRADPLFLDAIKVIERMRGTGGFEGKAEADEVIGAAITGVGPAAVLKVLPLNLENQGYYWPMDTVNNRSGNPGRAWMLPILKASVKNTQLGHFSSYFVPLSEQLYQRVLVSEKNKGKTMEVKILETVIEQIWALLPTYCDLPTDLMKVFPLFGFVDILDFQSTVCRAFSKCLVPTSQFTTYRVSRFDKLDRKEHSIVADESR